MTRLRRAGLAPERGPLAVAAEGPGGLRLVALDPEARALGLQPGEPLGRVRARIGVPLQVYPADPTADRDALLRLCRWAGGYAPLVAPFGPAEAGDGLYIDVAGASHLRGGEASLVDDLADRLARGHIPARIALADTPGPPLRWPATAGSTGSSCRRAGRPRLCGFCPCRPCGWIPARSRG